MSRVQIGAGVTLTILSDGYVMRNGSESVRVKGASIEDLSFSQAGLGTINVTRLKKAIVERTVPWEIMDLTMSRIAIKTFLENRDIDVARVKDILADDKLYNEPAISIYDEKDEQSYLVDGNHRVAAHLVRGEITFPAYVVPIAEIKPFLIEMWVNGEYYQETEADIKSTFGMHTDPQGNIRR